MGTDGMEPKALHPSFPFPGSWERMGTIGNGWAKQPMATPAGVQRRADAMPRPRSPNKKPSAEALRRAEAQAQRAEIERY